MGSFIILIEVILITHYKNYYLSVYEIKVGTALQCQVNKEINCQGEIWDPIFIFLNNLYKILVVLATKKEI